MSKIRLSYNPKSNSFLIKGMDKKARKAIISDIWPKIGSEYIVGTDDIIRGFPPEMEEALMPTVLGISRNTDDYDQKVKDYWAEFGFKVDPTEPLVLDMSVKKQIINGKEVEVPVNIKDFMKGWFAMQSSVVANNEERRANSSFYSFILEDLEQAKKEEVETIDLQDKALEAYLQLVKDIDSEFVENVLQMFKGKKGELEERLDITSKMETRDKKIVLSKIKDLYPTQLIALCADQNLVIKASISKALENGILTKEGDTYFLAGDDVPLARGMREMLTVFTDANKTKQVAIIRAKLENLKK